MFKETIKGLIPEIVAIEAKTQLTLKKSGILALDSDSFLKKKEIFLWMPALCLIAAKTAKDVNAKALQLAGILHLFNYACHLHFLLPEESDTGNIKNEVQYPILIGDMLYSQVCADLCKYDLQQYLDSITSLISLVHKELAQRDIKLNQNLTSKEHELECYAIISESACYLGSHVVCGNSHVTGLLRSLGYNLGFINAAMDLDFTAAPFKDYWYKAHSLTEMLPPGAGKDLFRYILLNMGSRWELDSSVLLCEKKA